MTSSTRKTTRPAWRRTLRDYVKRRHPGLWSAYLTDESLLRRGRFTLQQKVLYLMMKYGFRRKALDLPPVRCWREAPVEAHILTCRKDLLDAVWCLKTFLGFTRLHVDLFIHEDGSLDHAAIETLQRHFVGARVIRRAEADGIARGQLAHYPNSRRFRSARATAMKLFDFLFVARREKLLLLDSDLLFFRDAVEIHELIAQDHAFYMPDRFNAYDHTDELVARCGARLLPRVNTGLAYVPKSLIDWEVIESFLQLYDDAFGYWTEQTLYALLMSKHGGEFTMLSDKHQISFAPLDSETVSHHFVDDGSRGRLYTHGLRRIRSQYHELWAACQQLGAPTARLGEGDALSLPPSQKDGS